jgi:polar amino acid transport system substrate-binding protein
MARAETRILITLEWPPYTGVHEPGGGTITTLVNKVFRSMGDSTRVGYFSWRRVLQLPRTDRRFAASFPMYYSAERAEHCYFSEPIGEGPVGLVQRKDRPIGWKVADDLVRYKIGIVRGYVNSPEFDALLAEGKINSVPSETDAENLRNLLAGRTQAAVVDENTFHYLNTHAAGLKGMEGVLEMNQRLLMINKVYMCFPKDAQGMALRDRFNKALKAIETPLPGHPGPHPAPLPHGKAGTTSAKPAPAH